MTGIAGLLARAAEARPHKPALIAGERTVTYAEAWDRAGRTAAALAGLGVGKGDRVALLAGNVPGFVDVLYGATAIGAAVAPLNVMLTPEEAGYVLADAEPNVVVAQEPFLPTVLAVRDRLGSVDQVVVIGRAGPGTVGLEDLLAGAGEPPPVEVSDDDLALLCYTAGTTDSPKGAMLTHGNLLANLDQVTQVPALAETESDVVLLALPLFHIYALNAVLNLAVKERATSVLVERFDPVGTLEAVERHGVTVLAGAPPMFLAWLEGSEAKDLDLSSIRLAVSGAAPLPARVLDAFRDRFGIEIWEGYGLTETAPVVATTAAGGEARGDSIGLPIPGVDLKLLDEDGREVVDGDLGEILVRGPNVFSGYWRKPEESAAAFRDGWLRTGDVAYRGEDGYLFIVDRVKDLIIVSGFNVFPKEVEDAIATHPKVAACAVVGIADERTGEAVKALVLPVPGETVTEEDILDHCRDLLARFKWPRVIEIVEELPMHITGKVVRRRFREDA